MLRERTRRFALAEPTRRPMREKSSQAGEEGISESGIPEACIREACIREACMPEACMRPRFSTEICCERERVVLLSQSPCRPMREKSSQVGEAGISESGIPEACIREACIRDACMRDACMRPRFSTEICCERERVVSLSQSPHADRCGRSLLKRARQGYRSRACPRRVYARRAYATRVCVLDSAPKFVARENASFRSRRARTQTGAGEVFSSGRGRDIGVGHPRGVYTRGVHTRRRVCPRRVCVLDSAPSCERERVVSLSQSPHADRCGRSLLKRARQGYRSRASPRGVYTRGVYARGVYARGVYASSIQHRNLLRERTRRFALAEPARRPVREKSSQAGEAGISESGMPEACIRDACMRPRFSTEICCERERVVSLSQSPHADRCGRSLLKRARQGYRSRACPRRVYARRAYATRVCATRVCVLDSAPKSVARENASFRSRRASTQTDAGKVFSSGRGRDIGVGHARGVHMRECILDSAPKFVARENASFRSRRARADRCGRSLLK